MQVYLLKLRMDKGHWEVALPLPPKTLTSQKHKGSTKGLNPWKGFKGFTNNGGNMFLIADTGKKCSINVAE